MPNWELIDTNTMLGTKRYIAANEHEEDAVLVKTEFDPNQTRLLIDQNKAEANDATGSMGDMAKVASIPTQVMYEWLEKYGIWALNPHHADGVKRLLNSSDYRYLKVRNVII